MKVLFILLFNWFVLLYSSYLISTEFCLFFWFWWFFFQKCKTIQILKTKEKSIGLRISLISILNNFWCRYITSSLLIHIISIDYEILHSFSDIKVYSDHQMYNIKKAKVIFRRPAQNELLNMENKWFWKGISMWFKKIRLYLQIQLNIL